ncbi:MAG TPA: PAS domain-containing protein [Rhizomicrobium sp.]|jgi:hypothetical protein|nr:PAS domain-containing protein [Rhizomicrobium sp.]
MSELAIKTVWEPGPKTDKRLLALHAHWLSISPEGGIPRRADFNPAAIPKLLPWVFLLDVLEDPREFRFRVVGTGFSDAVGRDLTGLTTAEVFPPAFRDEVLDRWNDIVSKGGPNWGSGSFWIEGREYLNWQGLVLPFRSENSRIEQLLGGVVFGIEKLP